MMDSKEFEEKLHKIYASLDLCHRRLQALDERLRNLENEKLRSESDRSTCED